MQRVENSVAWLTTLAADLRLYDTTDNRHAALGAVTEALAYTEGLADTLAELRDALLP